MEGLIIIYTTVEKREDADKIASSLLERRLAACVQIHGPVTSIYWWKGKKESSGEWVCVIKTRKVLYEKAQALIKGLHPYETPEIVAADIVSGSSDYLEWIIKETS